MVWVSCLAIDFRLGLGMRQTLNLTSKNHENYESHNFNVLDHFWQVLKDISCLSPAVTRNDQMTR